MMPFNCSYRNKNEPTAIYPSLGYPVSNEASFFSILTNEACYYRRTIRPLGICATSEKQGGQHKTGFRPVQAAASFFVTLTVDGQNRDLMNIWRNVDVEGGEYLTAAPGVVQTGQHSLQAEPLLQRLDSKKYAL